MTRPKELNSVKRQERDRRIREYRRKHPGVSLRAMGRIFRMSHQNIIRILDKELSLAKER